jgi:hypothetical protein
VVFLRYYALLADFLLSVCVCNARLTYLLLRVCDRMYSGEPRGYTFDNMFNNDITKT